MQEATSILEAGVQRLLEDPKSYFRFASKFHQYSFNNCLLIMQQRPDATKVASYDKWKELNRQVLRGERGIKIFFPMFEKELDPDTQQPTGRMAIRGFGVGNVFDVSQTEGEPLPEQPTLVQTLGETEASKDLDRRISTHLIGAGLTLLKAPLGSARGVYARTRNAIALNTEIPYGDILTTKTLAHEAAHWAADHRAVAREDAETVAESAAFVVMSHYGMDTSDYSMGYVAHWAENVDRLKRNLGESQKVAGQLITAIEGEEPATMQEWS